MLNVDDKPERLYKKLQLGRYRYTTNVSGNDNVTVFINNGSIKTLKFADVPVFNFQIISNNGHESIDLLHGSFAYEHNTWIFYNCHLADSITNQNAINNAVVNNVSNAHYSMHTSATTDINRGLRIINHVINLKKD